MESVLLTETISTHISTSLYISWVACSKFLYSDFIAYSILLIDVTKALGHIIRDICCKFCVGRSYHAPMIERS